MPQGQLPVFKKPEPIKTALPASTGERPAFANLAAERQADAQRHAGDTAQRLKGAKGGSKGNKGRYA
jgi:hypothetical protein